MATNDFLTFAASVTANVYTNAEYADDPGQLNGNQPGIAKSKLVNKAIRQSSLMSVVLSQFIVDKTGSNAVDDGTTAALLADLKTATDVGFNINAATEKATPIDADELGIVDSAASNVLKKITWANLKATLKTYFDTLYQAVLVSGTNIKTINGASILGSGDLTTSAGVTLCTPVNVSGTAVDFTIPSGAKKIKVNLSQVSTNGSSSLLVQIGDAGGVEITGYTSNCSRINSGGVTSNSFTTGFGIYTESGSADSKSGTIELSLLNDSTNLWVSSGDFSGASTNTFQTAGTKALSASLTTVRLTTVNGTDTFDAGSANISWE